MGDGWVASAWHSTPEEFQGALETLNNALAERGRDSASFPNAVDTMFMHVDEDGDRARATAAPIIEKATGLPFAPDSGHYVVGDYEECAQTLKRWVNAGAKQICLWPLQDPAEQISLLGRHVLPTL